MTGISGPRHHPHPWVDRLHPYMTTTFEGLVASGLYVTDSWLDPMGPRDATFVYTDPTAGVPGKEFALVWDEVTGWRVGGFESGHQGVRTVLSDTKYLGGGVLPQGNDLFNRLRAGVSEPQHQYRSVADLRDGLDDALSHS
jgi:uncharacterized protein DUF6292